MTLYDYFTGLFSNLTSAFLVGTTTNDNAAAGNIGEAPRAAVLRAAAVNAAATGTYSDLASISLTPGDWDVAIVAGMIPATTQTGYEVGISSTSGNSSAGMNYGDNLIQQNVTGLGPAMDDSASIAAFRVSLAATTTYFFKILGYYTAGTPKFYGRISARRAR